MKGFIEAVDSICEMYKDGTHVLAEEIKRNPHEAELAVFHQMNRLQHKKALEDDIYVIPGRYHPKQKKWTWKDELRVDSQFFGMGIAFLSIAVGLAYVFSGIWMY